MNSRMVLALIFFVVTVSDYAAVIAALCARNSSKNALVVTRSGLVTNDRIDRRLLIYSIPGSWDGITHKRRTHFTWPVYHLEPSEIIYNDLSRIAEVELIYTNLESAEELKEKLGRGVWKEFEYVQKYGDFSLLERMALRARYKL